MSQLRRQLVALLSIATQDKPGCEDFAKQLLDRGVKIYASQGTHDYLVGALGTNPQICNVTDLVGPPILRHQVVTLSRDIHAGLIADETPAELAELAEYNISAIDLVWCTLYPLLPEIDRPGSSVATVREKTDLGGVALLRTAAKGRRIIVFRPEQMPDALELIDQPEMSERRKTWMRLTMAAHAEDHAATYVRASANYLLDAAAKMKPPE